MRKFKGIKNLLVTLVVMTPIFTASAQPLWVVVGTGLSTSSSGALVSNAIILTSHNASNWSQVQNLPTSSFSPQTVAYGGGKWIVAGQDSSTNIIMLASTDGATWTEIVPQKSSVFQQGDVISQITYDDGSKTWMGIGVRGNSGLIIQSTDGGVTWKTNVLPDGMLNFGKFGSLATDYKGTWMFNGISNTPPKPAATVLMTSKPMIPYNSTDWTVVSDNIFNGLLMRGVLYSDSYKKNRWLITGRNQSGFVFPGIYDSDEKAFTAGVLGPTSFQNTVLSPMKATHILDNWLAVGAMQVSTSSSVGTVYGIFMAPDDGTDATTWSILASGKDPESTGFSDVAYANGVAVAVGSDNMFAHTPLLAYNTSVDKTPTAWQFMDYSSLGAAIFISVAYGDDGGSSKN